MTETPAKSDLTHVGYCPNCHEDIFEDECGELVTDCECPLPETGDGL